ncbi:MAG: hypothetical protein RIQ93_1896 [Verrucomicrobiota bacterium]|jgi:hypothetical protein
MFRRLVLEDSVTLVTMVAFITALTIYLAFAWRALRMKRPQITRFENLPFDTPTPAADGGESGRPSGPASASGPSARFSATT